MIEKKKVKKNKKRKKNGFPSIIYKGNINDQAEQQ